MKLFVDGERILESKLEYKVYQALIETFESYDELTSIKSLSTCINA